MFRKKSVWLLIFIILVASVGGYFYYTRVAAAEPVTNESPALQTAVARRGDIVVFASAVGQVVPAKELEIGFDQSGTLIELLVSVGERVTTGQVLARLQTNNTPETIAASIADAELSVLKAQQDLDNLYANSQMEAAQALKAVEDSQEVLDNLQDTELTVAQTAKAVAEAEKSVLEAQTAYNNTHSTASQANIDAAYAELILKQEAYEKQQENYKDYADKPDGNLSKAQAQARLSSAQQAFESAQRTYNAMISTGTPLDQAIASADLAAAQSNLKEAQKEHEKALLGPTPGDVALAEAQLAEAKANWEVLQNGPNPNEIAIAEATLANAKTKLALAKEETAVIELTAPFDGTILEISANVGEAIGTGALFNIADLSQPNLEISLDETDLDKIKIGYETDVTFDALPDSTFTGHVISINPSLASSQNVQFIQAMVQLDPASFAKPIDLPVGLNASVDVIGGRAENAVLVPVEALRELGPDEYAVFVMENGEPTLRVVEVGLVDFTSAEITSGLEAGEVVTTGIVETQ